MLVGAALAALAAVACSDDEPDRQPETATSTPVATATNVPGIDERATLRGTLTLDGALLEAEFLGVRVVRSGLAAACQSTIPVVTAGQYEIEVAADTEKRGCGAAGAQVLLWAFVGDRYVYSSETASWPDGASATFDATFSSAAPAGASTPATELKGLLFDRDGDDLPGGTVIEAYVGDERCGVTSLPYGGVTEGYYTLIVAGPEAVPACAEGATVKFRIDGKPTVQTVVNDLGGSSSGHEVNLTLK